MCPYTVRPSPVRSYRVRPFLAVLPFVLCAACAQFPQVDAATDDSVAQAPFPSLVPAERVLRTEPARLDETSEADLQWRVNQLNRRAAALRKATID